MYIQLPAFAAFASDAIDTVQCVQVRWHTLTGLQAVSLPGRHGVDVAFGRKTEGGVP